MTLLELHGLRIQYGRGSHALTAVDGVTLSVPEGKTVGLVGESGCGKSSIARAIAGLAPVASGRITLKGDDVTDLRARNLPAYRRQVQMIFQDPGTSLSGRMTVSQMLSEAVGIGRPSAGSSERANRSGELLEMVGLPGRALSRYRHELSGGQRQRVAIARALAVEPALIITDEATSALDVAVQATTLNLLRDLQRELGISYLFITHDLSTVGYMSDTIAVMYLGRIVELASTEQLFAAPSHPYTRVLLNSVPKVSVRTRPQPLVGEIPDPYSPPPGCRFHTRCPYGPRFLSERTRCFEHDPSEAAASRPHEAACHFPLGSDEDAAAAAYSGVSEN